MCIANWKWIRQYATGIVPGKTYTYSGWYKGSASGIKSDVRLDFEDANGNSLGSGQAVYSGSGNWEQVKLTKTAPAGTVKCRVDLVNWTSGSGAYMLYSDLQLEEGSTATAYSETMGVYYPDYPRTDGTISGPTNPTGNNCVSINKTLPLGSSIALLQRAVTASFPDSFYIQCTEAGHTSCGIKVLDSTQPPVGSLVDLSGILIKDSNDELVISAGQVVPSAAAVPVSIFGPYGVTNKEIGGGTVGNAIGPDGGKGINLVGVLQMTWGRVSGLVRDTSMIIDDGSGCPVKVLGPTGMASNGNYVRVAGVSGIQKNGSGHDRILRTRTGDDVYILSLQ